MSDATVPYLNAYGNITKVLERIRSAQTPPRFNHDFLGTTLSLTGGSARPLIPFLKRVGFLASDGTPTDLYKRFRGDSSESGKAAAAALKTGYSALYEVNEYLHDATDAQLKGIIVQVTGAEPTSSTVGGIMGSFKALKALATFDSDEKQDPVADTEATDNRGVRGGTGRGPSGNLKLGYTINLNLPATSDIAVFDAIFKSIGEHLL